MNQILKRTFGHCIVPKNTIFFRGHSDRGFKPCMFFALSPFVAESFDRNNIQLWKTLVDIELLFLVEYLSDRAWAYSSLPKIYSMLFPGQEELSDMEIKHLDKKRRSRFVDKLYNEFNVQGWFSSLEGRIELEICLFDLDSCNAGIIKNTGMYQSSDASTFRNSLRRIKLFPSDEFYNKTRSKLQQMAPLFSQRSHYARYLRSTKFWYDGITGNELEREMENNYNLRLKLKI